MFSPFRGGKIEKGGEEVKGFFRLVQYLKRYIGFVIHLPLEFGEEVADESGLARLLFPGKEDHSSLP
jgi:hypothetical protein